MTRVRLRLEILWTWIVARHLLRRHEIRAAVAMLRRPRITRRRGAVAPERGYELGRAVDGTLAPLPIDSRCLVQSLVLTRMIARRGGVSCLVIGVRPGEDFGAHAWVEIDGIPVMPVADEFPRLAEL